MNVPPNSPLTSSSPLRERLRAADPFAVDAEGEELALARIAARLSKVESERTRPAHRYGFALPVLACGTILAVAWLGVRFVERSTAPGGKPESAPEGHVVGTASDSRQIQFETAGGTRVIWVLDPRFVL